MNNNTTGVGVGGGGGGNAAVNNNNSRMIVRGFCQICLTRTSCAFLVIGEHSICRVDFSSWAQPIAPLFAEESCFVYVKAVFGDIALGTFP